MLPGFTGAAASSRAASIGPHVYDARTRPDRVLTRADEPWSKPGGRGGHQEPGGGQVNCWSETTCAGVVRLCRTRCDNGTDSGWVTCGGCVGVAGVSLDLW